MRELNHLDADGDAHMVEVGDKAVTRRVAVAVGHIALGDAAWTTLLSGETPKGDVLAAARIAGIQAAKRTSDLIPLCHPLPLTGVDVDIVPNHTDRSVVVTASVRTIWRTGVEMEALTAVSVALLTLYDMLKAVDRSMEIRNVRLVSKDGGRSGPWSRT